MKKGLKPGPESGSLRSRIQTVLREKNTTPRGLSAKAVGKPLVLRSTTPKARENIRPVVRATATPLRLVLEEHAATPKTVCGWAGLPTSTKRPNLKLEPTEPFHQSSEWESPRYLSSPKEEDSSSEKETIVSVLNSAVPSPDKPAKDFEVTVRRFFKSENVRLVPKASASLQLPTTVLVVQGKECFLYDLLLS